MDYKKIITGMFIFLFIVCLSHPEQKQPTGLGMLEPLLNKTWVGMLKAPDGSSEFEVIRRFEAVWDGSVIKYSKTIRALNNSAEGYIYWDDVAKKTAFFFIESSGTFLSGYISADHNLITFEGKMTWPRANPQGKQVYDFRNTFEIISVSEMVDKWFHNAFGPWRPGHTIIFKAEEKPSHSFLPEDVYSDL